MAVHFELFGTSRLRSFDRILLPAILVTAGVTATWVPHRRNLIEAIKERPKPASTNQNRVNVEKSISKKNGSANGTTTNGETIEVTPTQIQQSRDTTTAPPDVRNATKRVEKTTTTNDNRDTNNNSEKNPKPKTKPNKDENVAKGKCHFTSP